MLVLARKVGKRVFIGDSIVVTVIEVRKDGTVRLGIDAPRDLVIYRDEHLPAEPPHQSAEPPQNQPANSAQRPPEDRKPPR